MALPGIDRDHAQRLWTAEPPRTASGRKRKPRTFSDTDYGGTAHALIAAITWRTSFDSCEVGGSARSSGERRGAGPATLTPSRSDNRSGVSGVNLVRRTDPLAPQRTVKARWQANWMDEDDRVRTRSFSIRANGYLGAWCLAVVERARRIGVPPIHRAPPPIERWLRDWAAEIGEDFLTR